MSKFLILFAAASALCAAELKTDIEFTKVGGESLTLDASVPDGPGPFPAVVIVHGGGFVRGTKTTYVTPLFPVLTEAKFAWFTINYRLADKAPFPAPIEDTRAAIAWVRKHSKEYKVDPNRLALIGESAGGHIVSYTGATEGAKLRLRGVVVFYGPAEVASHAAEHGGKVSVGMAQYLGITEEPRPEHAKRMADASPYTHITKKMPPFLLIHGTKDVQVDYAQSVKMKKKMDEVGVPCELITVNDGPHGMGSWDKVPNGSAYKQRMVEWLRERFR